MGPVCLASAVRRQQLGTGGRSMWAVGCALLGRASLLPKYGAPKLAEASSSHSLKKRTSSKPPSRFLSPAAKICCSRAASIGLRGLGTCAALSRRWRYQLQTERALLLLV